MIALLHTLKANVEKFDKLIKRHAPNTVIQHFVNEEILINALKSGETDYAGFNQEIDMINKFNPSRIICTCSSYGEASDQRGDVERIDRPVAEYIVKNYDRIGLAFAAQSTQGASFRLLQSSAQKIGKKVDIMDINCHNAWSHYQSRDYLAYAKSIAKTIKEEAHEVEAVFLAQASMEGTIEHLQELKIEVLASPEFGIKYYLK